VAIQKSVSRIAPYQKSVILQKCDNLPNYKVSEQHNMDIRCNEKLKSAVTYRLMSTAVMVF
jgi:hypothetical protein